MADQRIPTKPQRIRVYLRGGILAEGEAHVKSGAYRQRVSDLLNLQSAPFLPLTDVSYQAPGAPTRRTDAFLVHIPDIVAVDLGEDDISTARGSEEGDGSRPQTGARPPSGSSR